VYKIINWTLNFITTRAHSFDHFPLYVIRIISLPIPLLQYYSQRPLRPCNRDHLDINKYRPACVGTRFMCSDHALETGGPLIQGSSRGIKQVWTFYKNYPSTPWLTITTSVMKRLTTNYSTREHLALHCGPWFTNVENNESSKDWRRNGEEYG